MILTQPRAFGAFTGGRYGDFSGKTVFRPPLTQPRAFGVFTGQRYGSFAGRAASPPPPAPDQGGGSPVRRRKPIPRLLDRREFDRRDSRPVERPEDDRAARTPPRLFAAPVAPIGPAAEDSARVAALTAPLVSVLPPVGSGESPGPRSRFAKRPQPYDRTETLKRLQRLAEMVAKAERNRQRAAILLAMLMLAD